MSPCALHRRGSTCCRRPTPLLAWGREARTKFDEFPSPVVLHIREIVRQRLLLLLPLAPFFLLARGLGLWEAVVVVAVVVAAAAVNVVAG
jgi:hypothetical protein